MIKFKRLKRRDFENNKLHRWLAFFDKNTSDKTIQKLITMDVAIKKAHDKIMSVAQDKNMLHAYNMREMAVYDYNSGINTATKKGIEIGREEGIAIGKEEGIAIGKEEGIAIGKKEGIAISVMTLKYAGFPAEQVAQFVGLTVEEVNKIFEEQGLK
jgi:predicted transposase/invertase (TIGR01784 family)